MNKMIASFLITVSVFLGMILLAWLLNTFPVIGGTLFLLSIFAAFWSGIYNIMKE